ncbi:hypothetical protein GC173_08190 [bacterium]|nr:hypothetical protein [bacterium]
MSSGQEQAIEGARERARIATEGARGLATPSPATTVLRLGVIAAVLESSYRVDLIGSSGTTLETLTGVRAWGDSAFLVGDRVTIAWVGERPLPWIIGGAGAGGGSGAPMVTACLLANGE